MANPIIPITEPLTGVVTRVFQPWAYVDGKKTDKRAVDEQGQPITRLRVFGRILGASQEITIDVPDHAAEGVAPEDAVLVAGSSVRASLRGGDFGAVEATVLGAEALKIVSTAEQLFSSLAKVPTSGASSSASSSKES